MPDVEPNGSAKVTTQEIYALLLGIDKKVDRVETATATLVRTSDDHEQRLRELESHGSANSQEMEKSILVLRERSHQMAEQILLATVKADGLEETIKSTRQTLMRLAFLALTVAGSALVAVLSYQYAH